MPDPNEVMDVERTINELGDLCHEQYRGCTQDEYSYSNEVINMLDTDEGRAILNKLVAQQNAALLRELSKRQVTLHAGKRGQYKPVQAIPASILEAKLNELDTTKEVK